MDEAIVLRLEELKLHFNGLQVLGNVSFEVKKSELFALIGPNGAGKTSVLNCISGIYKPSSGKVFLKDQVITGLEPRQIAEQGIARTFQQGGLFPHMTVLDNLLVGRHCQIKSNPITEGIYWGPVRRQEIEHRKFVEEILDLVELGRYRKQRVANLSFGLQKVVGVARALAMEPQIILLDEPSSGLNREEKEDLARFILRIKHEMGMTMIWIEHDMQLIADLADTIYVLDYGEYVTHGDPEVVLKDPKVIEIYLGHSAEAS